MCKLSLSITYLYYHFLCLLPSISKNKPTQTTVAQVKLYTHLELAVYLKIIPPANWNSCQGVILRHTANTKCIYTGWPVLVFLCFVSQFCKSQFHSGCVLFIQPHWAQRLPLLLVLAVPSFLAIFSLCCLSDFLTQSNSLVSNSSYPNNEHKSQHNIPVRLFQGLLLLPCKLPKHTPCCRFLVCVMFFKFLCVVCIVSFTR